MKQQDINQSNLRHLMAYYTRKFNRAEQQILEAIPEWMSNCSDSTLSESLKAYHQYIPEQINALRRVTRDDESPVAAGNLPVRSFLEKIASSLQQEKGHERKNARILSAILTIIQFKINMYQMAAGFAHSLGMNDMYQVFHTGELNETGFLQGFQDLAVHIHPEQVQPIRMAG